MLVRNPLIVLVVVSRLVALVVVIVTVPSIAYANVFKGRGRL